MKYTNMTISEYIAYINEVYDEEMKKGNLNVVFDKPVRIVNENYKTDEQIKSLHLKVMKFIYSVHIINLIQEFADIYEDRSAMEYNEELDLLSICYFGNECENIIEYLKDNSTLTFKNLTFADYYIDFKIAQCIFPNDIKTNVIFENVDFNYIMSINDLLYGNHVESFIFRNVKMPCVKEFNSCLQNTSYDNVNAPYIKFK